MSEQEQTPEKLPKPRLFDDCSNCEQRYELTEDNSVVFNYTRQPECNFIYCACPNCDNRTRIFINPHSLEQARVAGIHIEDEEWASEQVYDDWCELKGIVLPETYQISDRHEKLIGQFGLTLANTPDEHLYDLIVDDGYSKPHPPRWN